MSLLDSKISEFIIKMDYTGDTQFLSGLIHDQDQIKFGSIMGSGDTLHITNEINSTIIRVHEKKPIFQSEYIVVEDGKGTELGTAYGSMIKKKKLIFKNVQGKEILSVIKSEKDKFSIIDENEKKIASFSRKKIQYPSKGILEKLKKNYKPLRLTYTLIAEDLMYDRILLWGCFTAFLISVYGYEPPGW